MNTGKCYACVRYFDCEFPNHSQNDLLWAKHLNGWFYWGKSADEKPGRWVKICRWCRDSLSQDN